MVTRRRPWLCHVLVGLRGAVLTSDITSGVFDAHGQAVCCLLIQSGSPQHLLPNKGTLPKGRRHERLNSPTTHQAVENITGRTAMFSVTAKPASKTEEIHQPAPRQRLLVPFLRLQDQYDAFQACPPEGKRLTRCSSACPWADAAEWIRRF